MTTHEITWKYILNQLIKHQNLSDTEVAWAMDQIMTGQTEQPILASLSLIHICNRTPRHTPRFAIPRENTRTAQITLTKEGIQQ